jgi:hypothetical protein
MTNPSVVALLFVMLLGCSDQGNGKSGTQQGYGYYVQQCLDSLIQYGTDRYGKIHTPVLVGILDVGSKECPQNPAALDEQWRVTRRERRNPAGANLLTDQHRRYCVATSVEQNVLCQW